MMKYHVEIFTGNSFKVQILYTVNNRKQNIRLTFSNILEHITIHPTHYISRKCIETLEYVIKQSPTVDKRHQFNTNFHAHFPVTKDDIIYIYIYDIYIYIWDPNFVITVCADILRFMQLSLNPSEFLSHLWIGWCHSKWPTRSREKPWQFEC